MTIEEVTTLVNTLNNGGDRPDGVLVLGICKKTGKEYTKIYISGEGLYEKKHGEFVQVMNSEEAALIFE